MFDLIVQNGKLQGRRLSLPLDKSIVVGRDEGCQLVLTSSLVSRRHTALCHRPDGIEVTDLGSQNGTYVNDVAISEPTLLKSGDILRIGACTFEVGHHQTSEPMAHSSHTHPKPGSVRRPVVPRQTVSHDVSDNEIADWLSDGDSGTNLAQGSSSSDTTIIRGSDVPSATAIPVSSPGAPAVAASSRPHAPPKKFRSVKDEAADIIRRHWAKVRGEEVTTD